MADAGTRVTPCNVFTSSRVLTNWLGKSASFLLSKTARALTVPVVVSIWLSSVSSFPLAIFVCAVLAARAFLRHPRSALQSHCEPVRHDSVPGPSVPGRADFRLAPATLAPVKALHGRCANRCQSADRPCLPVDPP